MTLSTRFFRSLRKRNQKMASPLSARSLTIPDDGCSSVSTSSSAMVGSEHLSLFQKRLLLNNWQHLTKTGSGGICNVMFQKFMTKRPETRKMFAKASVVSGFAGESTNALQDHIRLLTELIEKAVTNIDDLSETGKLCVTIGASHAQLKTEGAGHEFNGDLWDKFGQTMLESVTQLEVVRKHKELVRAWMILISFLIDKIRQGYTTAVRRQRFQEGRAATSCTTDEHANCRPTLADSVSQLSRSSQEVDDL